MKKTWKKSITTWLTMEKTKNNLFFARFSWLIFFLFSINIAKLVSSVKNTHYITFLKIFDNLATQERRLKEKSSIFIFLIPNNESKSAVFITSGSPTIGL